MISQPFGNTGQDLKTCCADFYASDVVQWLLGDSFHPGGLSLTYRLGTLLEFGPADHVLDVASGTGTSAIALAQQTGCRVTGIDFSQENVDAASNTAAEAGVTDRVTFTAGDAESMPFESGSFDALICECSFCTFPDQQKAAGEFFRVLRNGGRVGISDLTLDVALPPELDNVLGKIVCVAGAKTADVYAEILASAGLTIDAVEQHDEELLKLIEHIRQKLIGATLIARTQRISIPDIDFDQALSTARWATDAVKAGNLGYSVLVARR